MIMLDTQSDLRFWSPRWESNPRRSHYECDRFLLRTSTWSLSRYAASRTVSTVHTVPARSPCFRRTSGERLTEECDCQCAETSRRATLLTAGPPASPGSSTTSQVWSSGVDPEGCLGT